MANINNRQYDLYNDGSILLNSMKNGTSELAHALKMSDMALTTSLARRKDARDDHGRAQQTVTQLENALATARINAVITNNQLTANDDAVALSRRARNGQRVRTGAMHAATTAHVIQYLDDKGVQDLADGDRSLTRRVVEVTADAMDYPQWYSKLRRCHRIRPTLCPRDKTIGPAFEHLVTMNVLVMRRALTGTGYEYGLAAYFAALLPQPPRFDVPEPEDRQMYRELNDTSSEGSDADDE